MNSKLTEKISIILPTYNGSRYIRESIDSCLNQTYKNFELIIVDDASTDHTPDIVKSYTDPRIKYIRNQTNQRLPRSLNIGFQQAGGDYLTWTSDDNFYLNTAIEKMVHCLKDQNADFVYCDIYALNEDGLNGVSHVKLDGSETLNKHNCIRACFLYTRKIAETIGAYDPDMELVEDYDYWVRISKRFSMRHLPEPLYYYRYHEKSLWSSKVREIKIAEYLFKLKYDFMDIYFVNWHLRNLMVRQSKFYPLIIRKGMINLLFKNKFDRLLRDFKKGGMTFTDTKLTFNRLINKNSQSTLSPPHFRHFVFFRRIPPPPKGEWGGLERLMLDWVKRVDYNNCRLTLVVTPWWKTRFEQELKSTGLPVKVEALPFPLESSSWYRFFKMLGFLRELKADAAVFFQAWFWEFRCAEIIAGYFATKNHVFMHENLGAPQPPPKTSKKHFGFISGAGLWWYGKIFATRTRAYFCRSVLAVSQDLKDTLVQDWKYPEHKTRVAYHGVNTEKFNPSAAVKEEMRRSFGLTPDNIVMIATARLSGQKCLDRAIVAMHALTEQNPQLHLFIAGQGPLEAELKKIASEGLAKEKIHFLGQITDIPDYLRMSDIFILCSDNEGLSLALMEAMAAGLVCVSTTCAGSAEALQDGVTGFLVEKNTQSVEAGLRKAIQLSPEEKNHLSKAASQSICENFEINQNIAKIFDVIGIPVDQKTALNRSQKPRVTSNTSIIIATYNRSESLKRTLESLSKQDCNWDEIREIIIVDNNSHDGKTKSVVESLEPAFKGKLRYLFEAQQGKTLALNAAIKQASGDILIFTDDDVIFDNRWLSNMTDCFRANQCDGVGGRILPVYPPKAPDWIKENIQKLRGPIVAYDFGAHSSLYKKPDLEFLGANFAFRRQVFDDCGLFLTHIGPGKATFGDDTEFVNRALKAGKVLFYCGEALVWHPVEENRMSLRYFAKWNMALGRYRILVDHEGELEKGIAYWFGVPRYLIRLLIKDFFSGLAFSFDRSKLLDYWNRFFLNLGKADQIRKIYRQNIKVQRPHESTA